MPFGPYDDFEACVRDNQDKDSPEAYCGEIKKQVEGEAALSEDEAKALEESDCPDGHVSINDNCVPVEEVDDVPPGALDMSSPRFLESSFDPGPIEREERNGEVVYKNIKILTEGIWTDSNSKTPTHYVPENLELQEDNKLNLIHDADNEVSEIGYVENERNDNGTKYVDFVLHMDNSASEYADENLQKTLETKGAKGFGGPSVEIPAEGLDIERSGPRGVPMTASGIINGVGLVSNQADKNVSFARQSSERAVALSSSQTPLVYTLQGDSMTDGFVSKVLSEFDRELADPQDVQDEAETIADELDVPVGDVMEVLDPLFDMDEEEEGEEMADDDEEEEEENEGEDNDEEEEEGDDVEIDMEDKVASLEERISNLEGMVEEAMMSEDREELSAEIEDAKEELADAETVQELSDAKEELEKRLSKLEDEPEKTKTLADGSNDADWFEADAGVNYSSNRL